MAEPLAHLMERVRDEWLVGYEAEVLLRAIARALEDLESMTLPNLPVGALPKVLLVERDPLQFVAQFLAATLKPCHLFLGNPNWNVHEWQQVFELVQPDLLWANPDTLPRLPPASTPTLSAAILHPTSLIMIPTGGTSGQIRYAMHTWSTLARSVQGFQQHLGQETINSFCVMPLYHVSGLMQVLRSFISGGRLVVQPFKAIAAGDFGGIDPAEFFISLVPTQLQRLLEHPTQRRWLSRFQTVLLGGAPAWNDLLDLARYHRIRLALTYGMTETAAAIALLKPDEFHQGLNSCGSILPHVTLTIRSLEGQPLSAHQPGLITIQSAAIALGYYPEFFATREFQPDDLGFLDSQQYLHIVGRYSDKIITGGENVFPAEVEAAIRATGLVQDVCVVGVGDRTWGELVTAIYVPSHDDITDSQLQTGVKQTLSAYKCPKRWISVDMLPRNAQGKLNRQEIRSRFGSAATTE